MCGPPISQSAWIVRRRVAIFLGHLPEILRFDAIGELRH
jgi:hypothetical protein